MTKISAFVGMAVHKDTIAIAVADETRGGEVRFWGSVPNETTSINRLIKKISAKFPEAHFVYEAGPCGYGLHRHLS